MTGRDDAPTSYRQIRFTTSPGATELLLVRHGESAVYVPGSPPPMMNGHSDPELAPEGRQQAEQVALRLAGEDIDAIYVTPLRRTSETAAPLAERLGVTPSVEYELREVHLGEWEGGEFRQRVIEGHPLARRMYAEQRWDVVPGAEPTENFDRRVREGLRRICAAHPDERVVLFTHGGVIGQIFSIACGAGPFMFGHADNGSISHIVVEPERFNVRRFNDTTHLDPRFSVISTPLT